MKVRHALVSALLFAAPLPAQSTSAPWMEGCWADGRVQESWTRLRDGTLLGAGLMVRGDAREVSERLRLETARDRMTYIAEPTGQQRTRFPAVTANGDSLVVANADHDFPQRISYRRIGRDTMLVAVTGTEGGTPRGFGLTLVRRADCAAVAEVGVATPASGSTLRVHTATERTSGTLERLGMQSVALQQGDRLRDIALADIIRVDRRRRSAGRGALIGGAIGAAAFTGFLHLIVSALCESTDGCQRDHNRVWGYGIILGGAGGGLLGAGVGSLIPRWERVTP
jgi:hypothetical protein